MAGTKTGAEWADQREEASRAEAEVDELRARLAAAERAGASAEALTEATAAELREAKDALAGLAEAHDELAAGARDASAAELRLQERDAEWAAALRAAGREAGGTPESIEAFCGLVDRHLAGKGDLADEVPG
jgi:chromosome segregation ATPase